MTRKQFEEMTADLLEETIRITSRTLDEAEQRYPGIRGQISELLLVGGSSWMPAVAERLQAGVPLGAQARRPRPGRGQGRGAVRGGPDRPLRGVRRRDGQERPRTTGVGTTRRRALAPGPVTAEAVRARRRRRPAWTRSGSRSFAKRTVVNVLPKAVGIKLLDTSKPNWEDDPRRASYIEHLVAAQTQLPFQAEKFMASTAVAHQEAIEIEIWEQAGASPEPRAVGANHRVDEAGLIEGLAPFALPAGSPIDIDMGVDAEGTVHLVGRRAEERQGGQDVRQDQHPVRGAGGRGEGQRLAGLTVST